MKIKKEYINSENQFRVIRKFAIIPVLVIKRNYRGKSLEFDATKEYRWLETVYIKQQCRDLRLIGMDGHGKWMNREFITEEEYRSKVLL